MNCARTIVCRALKGLRHSAVVLAVVFMMALPLLAQTATTKFAPSISARCSVLFPKLPAVTCAASSGFAKVVFLTTNAYDANLGGTEGGNAICQTEANAAGLPGSYKAWLSTSNTYGGDAALKDEPLNTFNHSIVPYVLADPGLTEVAANWSEFASANHRADIGKDAAGKVVPQVGNDIVGAWTGTNADGTATTFNCNNWTTNANFGTSGTIGYANAISQPFGGIFGNWTDEGVPAGTVGFGCQNTGVHLYCVQQ